MKNRRIRDFWEGHLSASLTAAHLALDTHKLADDDPYHERVYAYNVSVPSVSGIPIDKLANDDPHDTTVFFSVSWGAQVCT